MIQSALRVGLWASLLAAAVSTADAVQSLTYTYDAIGRLTSVTYDDSLMTAYTYDAGGNLVSIETAPVASSTPAEPTDAALPAVFALGKIAPNPLQGTSVVRYDLPRAESVRLEVFEVSGRRVRTLVNGSVAAGFHRTGWDGRDDRGHRVANGIYFVRFDAGAFEQSKPIVVLR